MALSHVTYDALSFGPPGAGLAQGIWELMPWAAGVDIFFVISGFVMLHASEPLFERGLRGMHVFAARRVARIVPLYWLATTLFLLIAAVTTHAVAASLGGAGYVLASFAFIPLARPDGLIEPAYGLGWTLNYEMFFYLWFAAVLWLPRRRAVPVLTAGLTALVVIGRLVHPANASLQFWTSDIILEFLFGVWIRAALPRVGPLPGWMRGGIAVCALALLHANLFLLGVPRVLSWGVPAAALLFAAISGRRPATHRPATRWTSLWSGLGDASYALYLLHPFIMRGGEILWRRTGLHSTGATAAYIVLMLVATCAVAWVVHRKFEVPVTRRLRSWLEPKPSDALPARSALIRST